MKTIHIHQTDFFSCSELSSFVTRKSSILFLAFFFAMIFIGGVGCSSSNSKSDNSKSSAKPETKPATSKRTLIVTIVDNKNLAEELALQYRANYERKVQVDSIDLKSFQEGVDSDSLKADILIYPADLMPKLAATNKLRAMTKDRLRSIDHSNWLRYERELGSWKKKTWGVSLGSQFRVVIGKEEPASNSISLEELWSGGGRYWWPSPGNGADQSVVESIFSQAAALSRTRTQIDVFMNRFDGAAKIDSPSFVKTFQQLHSWAEQNKSANQPHWWKSQQYDGGWMNPFELTSSENRLGKDWKVLPMFHAENYYDEFQKKWVGRNPKESIPVLIHTGLVVSVAKSSSNERSAWKFIKMLSGKKTADRVVQKLDRPAIYLANQVNRLDSLLSETAIGPVADRLAPTYRKLESGVDYVAITLPRIPGWKQRIDDFYGTLEASMKKTSTIDESLKTCAESWNESLEKEKELTNSILRNLD